MALENTAVDQLNDVLGRIHKACDMAGRDPQSVALLVVSKTVEWSRVLDVHLAGQMAFGENYVQEGVEKIAQSRQWAAQLHTSATLSIQQTPSAAAPTTFDQNQREQGLNRLSPFVWHCIGPVQSNKTRVVAEHFDWVHSVDRLRIAQRLNDQRPANLPPLQVCLQVNVDGGENKSGVSPNELLSLAQAVAQLPSLRLRGLMAIPEPQPTVSEQRQVFAQVRQAFEALLAAGLPLDTLSMGMSADLEAAIMEGATMVRVGSALFGARQ